MKKAENEIIIAALIEHGTIKEAAASLSITPRTIYERMNNAEFVAEYDAARNDVLRQAVHNINSKLAQALEEVASIMTDKEVNAAVRLQAAQTIINNSTKLSERLLHEEFVCRQEKENARWHV